MYFAGDKHNGSFIRQDQTASLAKHQLSPARINESLYTLRTKLVEKRHDLVGMFGHRGSRFDRSRRHQEALVERTSDGYEERRDKACHIGG
jgi:hypothetical protein